MSGVYIKGMEMPRKCIRCPFEVFGNCTANKNKDVKKIVANAEKDCDCPLIPVPDHGRLIDADALVHSYYHAPSFPNLCRAINDAQTIIPADKEAGE